MKAFISSTYQDLKEYRKATANALSQFKIEILGMEWLGARDEDPTTAMLTEIEKCDIFIGIYAFRYGYIPPNSTISLIEQEYLQAKKSDKFILCFMLDDDTPWQTKNIDSVDSLSKLKNLKTRIQQERVVEYFTSPDNLAMKVANAIGRYTQEQPQIVSTSPYSRKKSSAQTRKTISKNQQNRSAKSISETDSAPSQLGYLEVNKTTKD